jgi:dTDP-4-dehydrorhamnose 3,5-epimerase
VKRIETALAGVCVLEPRVFGDHRGFFFESFNERTFAELGITCPFVQDNHSRSFRGVVRGLHYQLAKAQDKLVRVISGQVYDVAVDVRVGSPTFGRWIAVMLSAENKRMLFVPKGFAHGFSVISETAEFIYKCSDFYAPAEERGVIWNDPDLAIPWPLDGAVPTLSAKDAVYGTLATRPRAELPSFQAVDPGR